MKACDIFYTYFTNVPDTPNTLKLFNRALECVFSATIFIASFRSYVILMYSSVLSSVTTYSVACFLEE